MPFRTSPHSIYRLSNPRIHHTRHSSLSRGLGSVTSTGIPRTVLHVGFLIFLQTVFDTDPQPISLRKIFQRNALHLVAEWRESPIYAYLNQFPPVWLISHQDHLSPPR